MKLEKRKSSEKPEKNTGSESPDVNLDRRDFLNKMAKAAIPTIAFLSLGNLASLFAKPDKPSSGSDNFSGSSEANSCLLSCEGGCRTTCEGECRGTCQGLCYLTCEGSCKYTCEGGCNKTCEGCRGSCEGGCSGGAW